MSLKKFLSGKKLITHQTSAREIQNLLNLVDRDINDAKIEAISNDRRFITAYNAALQLATCVLYIAGYKTKPSKGGHHWISFAVLPDLLGTTAVAEYADYFDTCRNKRNISDYTHAGEISKVETEELISEVIEFRKIVTDWIQKSKPNYLLR